RVVRSGDGWEVTDRSGRRFLLGTSPAARIEETRDGVTRTYGWLIEHATDRNGNRVDYTYRRDRGQLYLESIGYGPYEIGFEYEPRPDALTDRRTGFAITSALRCASIDYQLPAEASPLFRRYVLTYDECPYTRLSLLSTVIFQGF